MLSIQFIRENPEEIRHGLARRGATDIPLDDILALDAQRRRSLQEVESIRAERNALSKEIGELARHPKAADHRRSDLVARSSLLGDKLDGLEQQLGDLEPRLRGLLLQVPNLPADSVPDGPDESANVMIRTEGEPVQPSFHKPHWELGEALGIIDFERGSKLAGSRFYVLKGA
ncbi:unnamed protein product, partial [marine sediment metagenome]